MFLRFSYFFPNLSLDVLIDMVLNQKYACIGTWKISLVKIYALTLSSSHLYELIIRLFVGNACKHVLIGLFCSEIF